MMEYITGKLNPGAFTDTAAAVLQAFMGGTWDPRPCDLNRDQLDALLYLRHAGYIEFAAYSGYRVKGQGAMIAPSESYVPYAREAIESITVCQSPANLIVMLKGGEWHKHTPTDGFYAALVTLAKSMGPGQVLRGRDNVLAYGDVSRLLGIKKAS